MQAGGNDANTGPAKLASGTRLVPLEGTFNFRDLGGYPTDYGRETRWGRLFRSDALQEMTPSDNAYLRGLGLTTVVDLRDPDEADRVGVWPSSVDGIRYHNLPVIPPRADVDPHGASRNREDRANRYLWYLEPGTGAPAITRAIQLIADADSVPLVFHCAAGKDRTGIVAALALSAVGVTREAIVADYAATTPAMEAILERLRAHPVYRAGIDATRTRDHWPDAEVMEQFLDGLEQRYGGAEAWLLRSAGMAPETIDRLRSVLVA